MRAAELRHLLLLSDTGRLSAWAQPQRALDSLGHVLHHFLYRVFAAGCGRRPTHGGESVRVLKKSHYCVSPAIDHGRQNQSVHTRFQVGNLRTMDWQVARNAWQPGGKDVEN